MAKLSKNGFMAMLVTSPAPARLPWPGLQYINKHWYLQILLISCKRGLKVCCSLADVLSD